MLVKRNKVFSNKALDLTPGSIAALRGHLFAGAGQRGRYMLKIICITFLLLLVIRPAMSCSFNDYPSFEEAAKSEPILLLVRVLEVSVNEEDIYENRVTISVLEIIKGKNLVNDHITLYQWPCFQHIGLLDLKKGHEYIIPLNRKNINDGEYMFLNNVRTLIEHKNGKLYTVSGQIKKPSFYMDYDKFIEKYGI